MKKQMIKKEEKTNKDLSLHINEPTEVRLDWN